MGWIWAIIIVAILGNLYLFSGYDVDGDIAEFMVGIALLVDFVIIGALAKKGFKVTKDACDDIKEKKNSEKKEAIVKEINNKLSHKNEIIQTFNKYFAKTDRQFALVSLITSCTSNNHELKKTFINSKENSFVSMKKEIFGILSKSEKKSFPKSVDEIINYKRLLENEITELRRTLTSIGTSDNETLSKIEQRHCPEMYKSIRRKKRNLITAIVVPAIIIIVSSILLSSGFALNLAKNYHQSVLKAKLITNNISSYSINAIEYEKQFKFSFEEDNDTTYYIKDITLSYENDFSNHSEDELEKTLRQLYRNLNVNITYRWAQHNLSFETDKYDYNIILIDKDGDRCSYDGDYFDIDK